MLLNRTAVGRAGHDVERVASEVSRSRYIPASMFSYVCTIFGTRLVPS